MIVVTAATGQLGHHVIEQLLAKGAPAKNIVAAVRNPEKASAFRAKGITVRQADYEKPETLEAAFAGADKVLLISSSTVGSRARQHKNAINAAKKAGVKHLAYTSILHADTSKLKLAAEHKETEDAIKASGIPYTFLRNGWYIENQTDTLAGSIGAGAFIGCSGDGKIAAATRQDYAEAAAVVLTSAGHENKAYELAGDTAYSAQEFAAEVSRQTGKNLPFNNLPEAQYAEILGTFGLPKPFAEILADADANAAKGQLEDSTGDLRRLIGHATTPFPGVVKASLAKL
jgi:NAD(P)H dehydrogenase (quinone)